MSEPLVEVNRGNGVECLHCGDIAVTYSSGKRIGNIGAEGVHCIGLKDLDIGIAIKVERGNMAMLLPIGLSVFEQLDLLNTHELGKLAAYRIVNNLNDLHAVVGYIKPRFTLEKC